MRTATLILLPLLLSAASPTIAPLAITIEQTEGPGAGTILELQWCESNLVPWLSTYGSEIVCSIDLGDGAQQFSLRLNGLTAQSIRVTIADDAWIEAYAFHPDLDLDGDVDQVDFGKIQAAYRADVIEWAGKQVTGAKQ